MDDSASTAVILWLVMGLIAGIINNSKGHSFASGCLVGFLFGPIGLVLALLSRPDQNALERRGVLTGKTKRCPYCAELIKAEANVCKHCGRDLPVQQDQQP